MARISARDSIEPLLHESGRTTLDDIDGTVLFCRYIVKYLHRAFTLELCELERRIIGKWLIN